MSMAGTKFEPTDSLREFKYWFKIMTCDEPSPQHPQDKQIKTIRQIIRELISNLHIQAKHNTIEAKNCIRADPNGT